MGGSNVNRPIDPSLEEKVAIITELLSMFDPSTSERYRERYLPLKRNHWWQKEYTVTAYSVAWSITNAHIERPYLYPVAQIVLDPSLPPRFMQRAARTGAGHPGWVFVSHETVITDWYDELLLGLKGDFAAIDSALNAERSRHAEIVVDRIITEAQREIEKSPTKRLEYQIKALALDPEAGDFTARRRQLINDMATNM